MASLFGSPDKGWSVEPGDTTVGIFGDAIYHEDCPLDEPPEATDEVMVSERKDDTLYLTHEVTCRCGATTTYIETAYDPIEEI